MNFLNILPVSLFTFSFYLFAPFSLSTSLFTPSLFCSIFINYFLVPLSHSVFSMTQLYLFKYLFTFTNYFSPNFHILFLLLCHSSFSLHLFFYPFCISYLNFSNAFKLYFYSPLFLYLLSIFLLINFSLLSQSTSLSLSLCFLFHFYYYFFFCQLSHLTFFTYLPMYFH